MGVTYRAAILHAPRTPLEVGRVTAQPLAEGDVLVKIGAAGLCHTDLEVIEGALRYPMPIVLGHEAAGTIAEVGAKVTGLRRGDRVVLSWNPHCGHCFYCDRDLPILCETYLASGPRAFHFDGRSRASSADGTALHHLMFLGAFAEYAIVDAQQAIATPSELPADVACLLGCGVMTGVGAALNVARIKPDTSVMVIGCGAVGLSAVQGARLARARAILAVDPDPSKLSLAAGFGATRTANPISEDAISAAKAMTAGRGVDCVIEAAGSPAAFQLSTEAVRPGGEIVWLGKIDVDQSVGFRWGALMQEKRIRRSSYGNARPAQDFPMLARAYLDGRLLLDELITARIGLDDLNEGFDSLRNGAAIRSVVVMDQPGSEGPVLLNRPHQGTDHAR